MRAKVITPVLALAMLILLVVWVVRPGLDPSPQEARSRAVTGVLAAGIPETPIHRSVSTRPTVLVASAPNSTQPSEDADSLETQRLAASMKRAAELRYLAITGDTSSLDTILTELPNPDPEIRRAALAAVVEFGDRSAMPALEEALDVNSDPQEKAGIQKAIEYLQLPSFDERDSAGSAALPAGASSIPAAN
jgi:hypothetical protein